MHLEVPDESFFPKTPEPEQVPPLQSPEHTWGFEAVDYKNRQAMAIYAMRDLSEGDETYAIQDYSQHGLGVFAMEATKEARRQFESYNSKLQQQQINQYFEATASPYIREQFTETNKHRKKPLSWSVWLASHDLVDNDTFMNVLQWHNHKLETLATSDDVERTFRVAKTQFLIQSNELYDEGLLALPPKEIEDAQLVAGDIFDTVLRQMGGYYVAGKSEVVVQQGEAPRNAEVQTFKNEFPRVLTHELVHMYLNRTLDDPNSPLRARWVNEALTENISQHIRWKNDPNFKDDGTYGHERKLFDFIISRQATKETAKRASRAFSGTDKDRTDFVSYVDEIWGVPDVITSVNSAIITEEEFIKSDKYTAPEHVQAKAVHRVYRRLTRTPSLVLSGYHGSHVSSLKTQAAQK